MDHCCPTETQSDADAHVDEIGPERVGNPLAEALVARLPGAAAVISARGIIVDANEGFCGLPVSSETHSWVA